MGFSNFRKAIPRRCEQDLEILTDHFCVTVPACPHVLNPGVFLITGLQTKQK
jgi:hypothetical protein